MVGILIVGIRCVELDPGPPGQIGDLGEERPGVQGAGRAFGKYQFPSGRRRPSAAGEERLGPPQSGIRGWIGLFTLVPQ
ncbi:MAG: hypothetical protein QOG76_132, partial [Pseudonocardiales bacterium]|nr:hypothetical protein [Pseudonocardiales bacterium]